MKNGLILPSSGFLSLSKSLHRILLKKKTVIILILTLFCHNLSAQLRQQQKRNYVAFAKLFGYVQYFHPSDEARKIDWQEFAIYGSQQMSPIENDRELIERLNKLFSALGPGIKVYSNKQRQAFSLEEITPPSKDTFDVISWQHMGFGLPPFKEEPAYQSIRLNRPPTSITGKDVYIPITKPVDLSAKLDHEFVFRMVLSERDKGLTFEPFVFYRNSGYKQSNNAFKLKWIDDKTLELSGMITEGSDKIVLGVLVGKDSNPQLNMRLLELYVRDKNNKLEKIPFDLAETSDVNRNDEVADYALGLEDIAEKTKSDSLFSEHVRIGEFIEEEIVPGISCTVPLALYGTKDFTYPQADPKALEYLQYDIAQSTTKEIRGYNRDIRMADIILAWNILKHSYPYQEDLSANQDSILETALNEAYQEQGSLDFLNTLKRISAYYNDGHMFVSSYVDVDSLNSGTSPIIFEKVENDIVVRDILDTALLPKINAGDILVSIDQKRALAKLKESDKLVSGSNQWKQFNALKNLLNGPKNSISQLVLKREDKNVEVEIVRDHDAVEYRRGNFSTTEPASGWIRKDIMYLNLAKDFTEHIMEVLAGSDSAKAIILDLRGYLNDQQVFDLPQIFLKQRSTLNSRFYTPKILYPDYKNVSYLIEGEEDFEVPDHIIKADIYVLIDPSAQSASETLIGIFKDLKIATLIGQPTSGANGSLNSIWLPGGYYVGYSGMKVLNSDGSKHHVKGIEADIYVERTLKGIKEKRDEVLEKALEISSQKN